MGIWKIESKTHMYHVWLFMLQKSSIEVDQAKLDKKPNAVLSMGDAKKLHHLSQQQKKKAIICCIHWDAYHLQVETNNRTVFLPKVPKIMVWSGTILRETITPGRP